MKLILHFLITHSLYPAPILFTIARPLSFAIQIIQFPISL